MKLRNAFVISLSLVAVTLLAGVAARPGRAAPVQNAAPTQSSDKLVYADFENSQDKRPLSSRGGVVQIISYQENATNPVRFKGIEGGNPPAPELVHLKPGDPNHAVAFDYELTAPNQYAGVGLEVHGLPDKDGKIVPDDVSEYKYVSLQVYAKGVSVLRLETLSRGQGFGSPNGFPQTVFKVSDGFNTYRIPLKNLNQPEWAQPRVSTKDVLKKLTSVSVSAFCNNCMPTKGTIVIDNIVFEK